MEGIKSTDGASYISYRYKEICHRQQRSITDSNVEQNQIVN